MKILHVIPSLSKGGAERLALDICEELGKQGAEVALVTFRKDNAYQNSMGSVRWEHIPSAVHLSISSHASANVGELDRFLDTFRPDIIHSHLFEAELVTRFSLRADTAYVSHCHDNMPQLEKLNFNTFFSKSRLTNYYERQWMIKKYRACNNHFIAISKNTADYFQRVLPDALSKNIHLLHNAINFLKFNSVSHTRDLSEIRIVNVGSFVPKKNQIFLTEIMRVLKNRNISAQLTFLGAGPEMNAVRAKAEQYDLTDRITFAGNVESVESYLRDANLYVHTAWYEPFGLVLIEAMASGLPVVALDGKGNRDIIQDGHNGFFIPNQDPEIFADKIISLFQNETTYRKMSDDATAYASGFDMESYTARLIKIYRELLDKKKG